MVLDQRLGVVDQHLLGDPSPDAECLLQRHWLQALEEAFRIWGGIPEQVLVDNAKALITHHNPSSGELVINPVFAAFARHWGFTVKACWPHRPQTKGKDERGVGYVKRSGI
ncbi:MAG: hypothetical protein ACKOPS_00945, partial [Cyanobium sp.]